MNLPTLYKQGNRGTETWRVDVAHFPKHSDIIVTWGMENGATQTKSTQIREGKNIGKANETNINEQAELEATSKWQKQIDRKGYAESLTAAANKKAVKIAPMLAKVYADHKHKLKYPVYVQPKLDGMRALTYLAGGEVVMMSRQGKEIETTDHIKDEIRAALKLFPGLVLDGELYQHGETFQSLISKVKRDEANDKSVEVKYHIYDCFYSCNPDEKFVYRQIALDNFFGGFKQNELNFVERVTTYPCVDEETVFFWHRNCLENGYEGSIVRGNAPYKIDGRSDQLLKLKEFTDGEFEIVGYKEDKNQHVVFLCKMDNGNTFDVKPEGTDEQRKKYLADAKELVGKMLTVKYFEFTVDGKPRFPVGLAIRDYE